MNPWLCIFVLAMLAMPGCIKSNPAAPTPPIVAGKALEPDESAHEALPLAPQVVTLDQPRLSEVETTPPPDEATLPPHIERFLLLARGGPLLIEAILTIDGKPLRATMDGLVDRLLLAADTNRDGRPTWDEVIASPAFTNGRYGNVEANSETEIARMVQLYDIDKDGTVDRDEVPRFLTRNAGGSRPFSLSSSNEYRGYNQFDAPTLHLLDTNRDGRLNSDEIASASRRLRSRDADGDDILVSADVVSGSLDGAPGRMSNRRRAAPDAAYLIDDQTAWDSLLYSLNELYAFGGELTAESFSQRRSLFEELDANNDNAITQKELQRLAIIEPHICLEVQFGRAATNVNSSATDQQPVENTTSPQPRLRLVSLADELRSGKIAMAIRDARIALTLADGGVVFFANDGAGVDYRVQAQSQIALYDANNDGYLEEAELPDGLPGVAMSWEALDEDQDGKLYPDELTEYLRQRAGAALSQVRARVADQADALFVALDADHDGRLETREFDLASETLRRLDADQDGLVISQEIPGAMAVGFVRGDPQQADAQFVIPTEPEPLAAQAPAWFQAMDVNGDEEISRREFLGEADQFAGMDANADGFLDVREARRQ